jgi:hypothetical protein
VSPLHTLGDLDLGPPRGAPRPREHDIARCWRSDREHADVIAVTDADGAVLGSVTRNDVLQ